MSYNLKLNDMAEEGDEIMRKLRDNTDYVICPLEKAHTIKEESIQFHLVKCLANFRGKKDTLKTCPFDTTHVVTVNELIAHVSNCTSRGLFDRYKYQIGGAEVNAEIPPPPVIADVGESWDSCDLPTYDKEKELEDRPVLRKKMGAKPSERKQFRFQQRDKFGQMY